MIGYVPHGSTARAGFALEVTPEQAGWAFSGLRVIELEAGQSASLHTAEDEMIVLPLAGSATVRVDAEEFTLHGRDDVFAGVTDFVYAPRDADLKMFARDGGRFALPSARADRRLSARHVSGADVPVELRGAGQASRQVNNFCSPEAFEADRLIAVEVLTPGGNWSSYPPHKHDEYIPGEEVPLEEIYYFEVADGPAGPGFGYQRVYSSGPGRELDVCAEVHTGDMLLMPYGYHGPSMAAPGYDLYYLNVMAGPLQRSWQFRDDPRHAWIRTIWAEQQVDPRLPMTTAAAGAESGR
jgi:5-deoxy-glucuronate isomerase